MNEDLIIARFTAAVLESQRLGLSLDEPTEPLPEDE